MLSTLNIYLFQNGSRIIPILAIFLFTFYGCSSSTTKSEYYKLSKLDSINDYFFEITTKNEYYPNRVKKPMKWKKKDISIALMGKPKSNDIKVFKEVTRYIENYLNISFRYSDSEDADILFFIGSNDYFENELSEYFPRKIFSDGNSTALFFFKTNIFDRTSINRSFVFISEGVIPKYKKHLFLEELVQSMGFPNDSYKYPNSIFYQGGSCDTVFNYMDSAIIKILYP
jgi:hypothetical protein